MDTHDPKLEREHHEKMLAEAAEKRLREQRNKVIRSWAIFLLLIGGFGYWSYSYYANAPTFRGGDVHWHTQLEMEVCGTKIDLPRIGEGAHHRGLPLLHTHDDNVMHVEGYVSNPADVTLGRFMHAVGVTFSDKEFFDKKNGDLCNGQPGMVKMWVNHEPSTIYKDYSAKDGDIVTIKFEP
ncbi:hypothetical protein HY639_05340 [Candidatus Woesearchaeota archaeon]|nr:hypothetical protein [Candidatus Woesearchaeota archaeon]